MQIRLLGVPEVKFTNGLSPKFKTAKAEGLFYYLATTQRIHPRTTLATLFWGDMEESKARVNLSKALSDLREQVGDYITITPQAVAFNKALSYQLDIEAFSSVTTSQPNPAIDALQRQTDLYRGDFLEGFYVRNAPDFEVWGQGERERLRTTAAQRLAALAEGYQQNGNLANAISTLRRLLTLEPWREAAHYQLMDLLARNGETPAALRQYELCRLALADELDVEPGPAIKQLYTQIRTNGKAAEPREHSAALSAKSTASKPSIYLPQLATPFVGRAGEIMDLATPQPELVANAPFVGRQAEWQTLQARWRLALRNQPQFVLIAGEAGIGKTRLAEELLNWAQHHGFGTVRARCYAAEGRLTYAPIIEWLRADTVRPHRSKVAATWLTELARLLPELLTEQPNLPRPEPITSTWLRHQLFEAATRALLALDQPLLLLIDDLQWCDKETLELLHFLLRNAATLSQTKVLLIGTARLPDEVEATHPLYELLNPLRGGDTLTQLDLVRLTEAETNQLARQMTERTLDNQTLHQLFHDTAGNPLFVVETMRATQGQSPHPSPPLGSAGIASLLSLGESEASLPYLPPKVHAVIQARLGQLSPTARELCEWAAIVGRAFTLELLTSASKIAADKVVNALDELWQRRIIREQGTVAYDFSHDRIRDVAAAGISRVRQRYLHRCVAEALEHESTGQLDAIAAQIAAHYDVAGVIDKAIDFYMLAAERTPLLYANDETVALLQRAHTLLKTQPETKQRDHRELSLLIALGPALASISNTAMTRLREVYERAYILSQQLAVPLPPNLLRILATHKLARFGFAEGENIGEQLCKIAKQPSGKVDAVLYLEGCYILGAASFWQGHFLRSREYLQRVVDSYSQVRQLRHVIEFGVETGIYCRTRLGWTLWYLGYPDQSRRQCEISLELAQQQGHSYTLFLVSSYSVHSAFDRREADLGEKLLRWQETTQGKTSTRPGEQFGFLEGWLWLLRGKPDESLQRFCEHIKMCNQMAISSTVYPHNFTLLADAYRQLGNYQQGLITIDEAFHLLNGLETYWYIAELYRIQGELLIGQGADLAKAEACLQQALEISRRQAAKSLELRAAMSLAQLWDQQGKRQEAYTLLAESYNWFTEGFDTADLQEAKSLLARLA